MALSATQINDLFRKREVEIRQTLTLNEYLRTLYNEFTPDEQAEIVIDIMTNFQQAQLDRVRHWLTEYD